MKKRPKQITEMSELKAGLYIRILGSIEDPVCIEVIKLNGRPYKYKFEGLSLVAYKYPSNDTVSTRDYHFVNDMIKTGVAYKYTAKLLAQLEENNRVNKINTKEYVIQLNDGCGHLMQFYR